MLQLYFLQPGTKRAHQPEAVEVGMLCADAGDDGGDGRDEKVDCWASAVVVGDNTGVSKASTDSACRFE